MSNKSPRHLALAAAAALSLIAGACGSSAINDLVSDQIPEAKEAESTTADGETTDLATEPAQAEVLGETEEAADTDAEAGAADETAEEGPAEEESAAEDAEADSTLSDLISAIESSEPVQGDAGLSEEDSLTLGTDLGDAEGVRYAIVGVDRGLNVRASASVNSDLVYQVERDRVLTGTGNEDGAWAEVTIDGFTGFVPRQYLAETDAVDPVVTTTTTAAPSTTPATFTVVNVEAGVNLRSGPGVGNAIVGGAALGEIVTATGNVADGWTEVTHDGTTGWASSDRLAAN